MDGVSSATVPAGTKLVSDLNLLKLEGKALEFFLTNISCDEEAVRRRIIEVQKE